MAQEARNLTFNLSETQNAILYIDKFPDLIYNLTDFSLPSLTLGVLELATPIVPVKRAGTSLDLSPIPITFLVDEKLDNYIKIVKWILALKELSLLDESAQEQNIEELKTLNDSLYANAILKFYTNMKNSQTSVTYTFYDCFPDSISELPFSFRATDWEALTCDMSLQYTNFDIKLEE